MKIAVLVKGQLDRQTEETWTEYLVSVPFHAQGSTIVEFLNNLLKNGLGESRYVEVSHFGIQGVFFPQGAKTVEIEARPVLLPSGKDNKGDMHD